MLEKLFISSSVFGIAPHLYIYVLNVTILLFCYLCFKLFRVERCHWIFSYPNFSIRKYSSWTYLNAHQLIICSNL